MVHFNVIQKNYIATEKKGDELPLLKINCSQVDNNVKFSRDWLDYIEFTPNV